MKLAYLRTLCLCVFYMHCVPVLAQDNSYIKNKIKLPPSPNAAALGKYGEIPVSKFTGMANIGVPLLDLKSGEIPISINLSYHNSGFKIDDRASWTGAGWTLNAGGVITRVIQGQPDEAAFGYNNVMGIGGTIDAPDPITDIVNFTPLRVNLTFEEKKLLATGVWDGIQDIFYFNFMGRSGKLLITKRGIYTVPYQALKVEKTTDNWVITDEAGIKYVFGVSGDRNGIEITEYDDSDAIPETPLRPPTKTAWYLVDIVSPKGDLVTLEYESETVSVRGQDSQTRFYYTGPISTQALEETKACKPLTSPQDSYATILYISSKRLSKIKFSEGEINFVADTLRNDVFSGNLVSRLDHVLLKDSQGEIIKKFNFGYSYFGRSNINTSSEIFNRLILNSVTEESTNGDLNKPYQFVYNNGTFPSSKTYSIDHWGYYNGKPNGTSLVPWKLGSLYDQHFQTSFSIREPDSVYSAIGLLTKMIYPSGGSSEFKYEVHDYSYINGLRIPLEYKSIPGYVSANVNNPAIGNNIVKEQVMPFTIQTAQKVQVNYRLQRSTFNGLGENFVSLYKNGESAPIFTNSGEDTGQQQAYLDLTAGNYTILAHIEDKGYNADINVSYVSHDYNVIIKNKHASGFRIKQVINAYAKDNFVKDTISYIYRLEEDGGRSSGILNASPSYEYNTTIVGEFFQLEPVRFPHECECRMIARTSNSIAPLGASDGGVVTYSQVKILRNGGANGSSRSWFTSALDFPDQVFNLPPFAPTQSFSFKRGLLKKEIDFDSNGRNVQKTLNEYEYNSSLSSPNLFATGNLVFSFDIYFRQRMSRPATFLSILYTNRSEWHYLKKSTKINYTYGVTGAADSLSTSTEYIYNNPSHIQLSGTKTVNSKGQILSTVNRYPQEMVVSGKTMPYQEMVDKHMFTAIEQEQQLNSVKLNKHMTTYKLGGTLAPNLILRDSVNTQFKNETLESRLRYLQYDDEGNPLSVVQEKGIKMCYVWAYGKSVPIAEISNADYATVASVLGGSSAINKFCSILLPTDAQVNNFLAPLRTSSSLKDALITAITFKPLVGVTSQTDSKGMTTYYKYDNFQRLKHIKDQNGNIVKSYDYQYRR